MTDNQQKWAYVILILVVPFLLVHIFSFSSIPRLLGVIIAFSVVPILGIAFSLNPKAKLLADDSKLNKTADPVTPHRWTKVFRLFVFLLSVLWFLYFTAPIWVSTFKVYAMNQPLTIVTDTATHLSSAVLAPGVYLGVSLSEFPNITYAYLFPTIYQLEDSKYQYTILTGTNFILKVAPI